jgi:hypothetical protein
VRPNAVSFALKFHVLNHYEALNLARWKAAIHIVEVRRKGADLRSAMAQMRTWVDHHRLEPQAFEVGFIPGGEVRFHLSFAALSDASVFARAFDGERASRIDSIVVAWRDRRSPACRVRSSVVAVTQAVPPPGPATRRRVPAGK